MIVLTRVDDRLIHGQVVVAWGQAVTPDRYVLADDEIAAETDEHDIYRAGVPSGKSVSFLTVEETGKQFNDLQTSPERIVLLLPDVESALRLAAAAPGLSNLNLGGVHDTHGRTARLPYLYLSEQEVKGLSGLSERGVVVTAQDVPTAAAVPLGDLA